MRSTRVCLDELLSARRDAEGAQGMGRSKVFRRDESREAIAAQYRKAYEGGVGLGPEFEGWEDQGVWPSE